MSLLGKSVARLLLVAAAVGCGLAVIATPEGAGQQYQTMGPASCTNATCHPNEAAWWNGDPHKRSADIYLLGGNEFVAMALKFGIAEGDDAALNAACFQCHGTVLSGSESEEIEYGVSCESCHGPGSGYRDPHQKNYEAGVNTGMLAAKDTRIRAQMCIDCHLTTDQKLLRAQHPPGWTSSGKYVRGIGGIARHWKEQIQADTDPAPFDAILADAVVVIPDPGPPPGPAATQAPRAAVTVTRTIIQEVLIPGGAWIYTKPTSLNPIDLSGGPAHPDSGSVDVLLLQWKRRIERAYAALDSAYAP